MNTALPVVVLDACALLPAALRDTLLRAAGAGLYRMRWTDDILEEVRRNLISELRVPEDKAQRLIDRMSERFPEAIVTHYRFLIDAMPNNLKDRHVLAAAVAGKAQSIVTLNLRHFPQDILASFAIQAQSPDEFLVHLFHITPARMREIIEKQARALHNPPLTVAEILDNLALHAPTFATFMRKEFDR